MRDRQVTAVRRQLLAAEKLARIEAASLRACYAADKTGDLWNGNAPTCLSMSRLKLPSTHRSLTSTVDTMLQLFVIML